MLSVRKLPGLVFTEFGLVLSVRDSDCSSCLQNNVGYHQVYKMVRVEHFCYVFDMGGKEITESFRQCGKTVKLW